LERSLQLYFDRFESDVPPILLGLCSDARGRRDKPGDDAVAGTSPATTLWRWQVVQYDRELL